MTQPAIVDVTIREGIDIFDGALDHARKQTTPHDVWLNPVHREAVGLARTADYTYLAALNDAGIWHVNGTHVRFDSSLPEDVAQVRPRAGFVSTGALAGASG